MSRLNAAGIHQDLARDSCAYGESDPTREFLAENIGRMLTP